MVVKNYQTKALFFGVFLLLAIVFTERAHADVACADLPDGNPCKIGADSKSYTPGVCENHVCKETSTTISTPQTGPGSNGQAVDYIVPGKISEDSKFINCGRAGRRMCTLCDLIAGLNNVIRFIEKIAVGVGVLAFTIAGVIYIISGGDSATTGKAKTTMKNAAIGFVIIFAAWVIVNTAITSIGAYSNLGINITSWGQFDCNARAR